MIVVLKSHLQTNSHCSRGSIGFQHVKNSSRYDEDGAMPVSSFFCFQGQLWLWKRGRGKSEWLFPSYNGCSHQFM